LPALGNPDPGGVMMKIMIVDDSEPVRSFLRAMLLRVTDDICTAEDGEEAVSRYMVELPDLVLMDIRMPRMDGITDRVSALVQLAQRYLAGDRERCPALLDAAPATATRPGNSSAGCGPASPCSTWRCRVSGIEKAAGGEYYISPSLTPMLLERNHAPDSGIGYLLHLGRLSPVERQVLRHIADARSSRSIAAHLAVSVRTVESHRYNISKKPGLSESCALLRFALDNRELI
jgi:DNA-binding NarL/FixJ family response regulator